MTVLSRRARTAESRRANERALIESTLRLLQDGSSFADLKIEQIVGQAGLSRPTFYAYFDDKRALVLQLGTELERDLIAVADPWFQSDETSARETVRAVVEVFRTHREAVLAITEAATYDAEVAAFWRSFHDSFIPGSRRRIQNVSPDLDDSAVLARAYALIYMTERTILEQMTRGLTTDEALTDQLAWFWERATRAE